MLKRAERLTRIPPYVLAEIDKVKQNLLRQGVDLIDLGVGDPDKPTPAPVIERLAVEAANPRYHRYPAYEGSDEVRAAMCRYYKKRFGVELDPGSEAIALIGSKEGLAHLIWAFVDPGDVALVPDPAYPVYWAQTLLSGGTPHAMPLLAENGFLPDLDAISPGIANKSTIMFLNYPNNPTAGIATMEFFKRAVDFCARYGILLCHDAAYAEMTYDGYVAPSILEVEGAREVAIETYSWSKPFNMTGWRIACALGAKEAVSALRVVKTNTDSGQFTAVQMAAIAALESSPEEFIARMNVMYTRRRDVLIRGLWELGLEPPAPKGSFYVWCPVPRGHDSASFTRLLLEKALVIVVPGTAYGATGEGFVRIALTVDEDKLEQAVVRIGRALRSE
jgi:LL-diaminopimelate aminotransferase